MDFKPITGEQTLADRVSAVDRLLLTLTGDFSFPKILLHGSLSGFHPIE
jgi:hypothetical protein